MINSVYVPGKRLLFQQQDAYRFIYKKGKVILLSTTKNKTVMKNKFYQLLFLLPVLCVTAIRAQVIPAASADPSAYEKKLLKAVNIQDQSLLSLNGPGIISKEGNHTILSGTSTFLGTPGVLFKAIFDETDKLSAVSGQLPESLGKGLTLLGKKDGIQVDSAGKTILKFTGLNTENNQGSFLSLITGALNHETKPGAAADLISGKEGYQFKLNGNLNGMMNGIFDIKALSFADLLNSDIKLSADTAHLQHKLIGFLPAALSLLGFGNDVFQKLEEQRIRVESMTMSGKVKDLQTAMPASLVYYVGSDKKTVNTSWLASDSATFYKDLSGKMSGQLSDLCGLFKNQLMSMAKETAAKTLLDAAGGRPVRAMRLVRRLFRSQKNDNN